MTDLLKHAGDALKNLITYADGCLRADAIDDGSVIDFETFPEARAILKEIEAAQAMPTGIDRLVARCRADLATQPVPVGMLNADEVAGAVARGWCHPSNSHKEMDTDLAFAIRDEIMALAAAPSLPPEPMVTPYITQEQFDKTFPAAPDGRVELPVVALHDVIGKAMRKAWQLGQTYWQQADSDYTSQHKKADITQQKFDQLVEETQAAIAAAQGGTTK